MTTRHFEAPKSRFTMLFRGEDFLYDGILKAATEHVRNTKSGMNHVVCTCADMKENVACVCVVLCCWCRRGGGAHLFASCHCGGNSYHAAMEQGTRPGSAEAVLLDLN